MSVVCNVFDCVFSRSLFSFLSLFALFSRFHSLIISLLFHLLEDAFRAATQRPKARRIVRVVNERSADTGLKFEDEELL